MNHQFFASFRSFFEQTLDASPHMLLVAVDSGGLILDGNAGLLRALGVSQVPVGKKFVEFLDQPSQEKWRQNSHSEENEFILHFVNVDHATSTYICHHSRGKESSLVFGILHMIHHGQILEEFAEMEQELSQSNRALQRTIKELEKARDEIKTLSELLPMCSYCRQIRNDEGYWESLERYIATHSETQFSHGICPECFPGVMKEIEEMKVRRK